MTRLVKANTWLTRYAGVVVIVMALLGSTGYVVEQHRTNARANCNADFSQAFAQAVVARAATATARTDAQDTLLNTIASLFLAPPTKDAKVQAARTEQFLKALADYQAASGSADQSKDANPYPANPHC